jgi:hypothetical protein
VCPNARRCKHRDLTSVSLHDTGSAVAFSRPPAAGASACTFCSPGSYSDLTGVWLMHAHARTHNYEISRKYCCLAGLRMGTEGEKLQHEEIVSGRLIENGESSGNASLSRWESTRAECQCVPVTEEGEPGSSNAHSECVHFFDGWVREKKGIRHSNG